MAFSPGNTIPVVDIENISSFYTIKSDEIGFFFPGFFVYTGSFILPKQYETFICFTAKLNGTGSPEVEEEILSLVSPPYANNNILFIANIEKTNPYFIDLLGKTFDNCFLTILEPIVASPTIDKIFIGENGDASEGGMFSSWNSLTKNTFTSYKGIDNGAALVYYFLSSDGTHNVNINDVIISKSTNQIPNSMIMGTNIPIGMGNTYDGEDGYQIYSIDGGISWLSAGNITQNTYFFAYNPYCYKFYAFDDFNYTSIIQVWNVINDIDGPSGPSTALIDVEGSKGLAYQYSAVYCPENNHKITVCFNGGKVLQITIDDDYAEYYNPHLTNGAPVHVAYGFFPSPPDPTYTGANFYDIAYNSSGNFFTAGPTGVQKSIDYNFVNLTNVFSDESVNSIAIGTMADSTTWTTQAFISAPGIFRSINNNNIALFYYAGPGALGGYSIYTPGTGWSALADIPTVAHVDQKWQAINNNNIAVGVNIYSIYTPGTGWSASFSMPNGDWWAINDNNIAISFTDWIYTIYDPVTGWSTPQNLDIVNPTSINNNNIVVGTNGQYAIYSAGTWTYGTFGSPSTWQINNNNIAISDGGYWCQYITGVGWTTPALITTLGYNGFRGINDNNIVLTNGNLWTRYLGGGIWQTLDTLDLDYAYSINNNNIAVGESGYWSQLTTVNREVILTGGSLSTMNYSSDDGTTWKVLNNITTNESMNTPVLSITTFDSPLQFIFITQKYVYIGDPYIGFRQLLNSGFSDRDSFINSVFAINKFINAVKQNNNPTLPINLYSFNGGISFGSGGVPPILDVNIQTNRPRSATGFFDSILHYVHITSSNPPVAYFTNNIALPNSRCTFPPNTQTLNYITTNTTDSFVIATSSGLLYSGPLKTGAAGIGRKFFRTNAPNYNFNAVIWNPIFKQYWAYGREVFYSLDGVNWLLSLPPMPPSIVTPILMGAQGGDDFVSLSYSIDYGINWVNFDGPPAFDQNVALTFFNGRFILAIAIKYPNEITLYWYNSDDPAWYSIFNFVLPINNDYGTGNFVISDQTLIYNIQSTTTGTISSFTSTDGLVWIPNLSRLLMNDT